MSAAEKSGQDWATVEADAHAEMAIEAIESDADLDRVMWAVDALIHSARQGDAAAFEGLEIVGVLQPHGHVYDRIADFLEDTCGDSSPETSSMAARTLRDIRKERHDYAA